MDLYITNPRTGRRIRVGGPTYNRLMSEGLDLGSIPAGVGRSSGASTRRSTETSSVFSPLEAPALSVQPFVLELPGSPEPQTIPIRPSPSRGMAGWAAVSPKRGIQRRELFNHCGESCFLDPARLMFPICPRCQDGVCDCTPDCRGLLAAKARARQHGYPNIAEAAQQLARERNCGWTKP